MYFKAVSPIVMRIPVEKGGKLTYSYIFPHTHTKLFEYKLTENIVRKVRVYTENIPHVEVKVDREYMGRRTQYLIKPGKDPTVYM